MNSRNSIDRRPGRQPGICPRVSRVLAFVLLGCAIFGHTGCNSVYKDAAAHYPGTAEERVEVLSREARQAARKAEQAAAFLRRAEDRGVSEEALIPRIDRLERAARDLRRRATALRHAVPTGSAPDQAAALADQLEVRAEEWLAVAEAARTR